MRRHRGTLILDLLLALGSLFALFIVLELGLRLVGYDPMGTVLDQNMGIDSLSLLRPSDDPALRYELVPDVSGFAFQTEVETNSHGFRDREWAAEKGDAYRIAVLGDSIAFGNYMPAERRFSDLLQASLDGHLARSVEVMNLAVTGYDTLQQVIMLERRGIPLSPDLVVIAYCVNDLGVVTFNERYLHDAPRVDSPFYRLRLAQLVRNKLDVLEQVIRFRTANEERQFAMDNAPYILPVEQDAELMRLVDELRLRLDEEEGSGWLGSPTDTVARWYTSPSRIGKLEYALQRLASLGAAHGFDVALMPVPYLKPDDAYGAVRRIVEHEARKHGFDVVSLAEAFEAHGLRELRFDDRPGDKIHPNEEGHRLIAARLRDYVAPRAGRHPQPRRGERPEAARGREEE